MMKTSTETELWTFANLNLAIVYLRTKREQEFMALFDRINPECLPSRYYNYFMKMWWDWVKKLDSDD